MVFLANLKDFQFFLEVTFVGERSIEKEIVILCISLVEENSTTCCHRVLLFQCTKKKVTVDCSFAKLVFQRQVANARASWTTGQKTHYNNTSRKTPNNSRSAASLWQLAGVAIFHNFFKIQYTHNIIFKLHLISVL